MTEATITTVEEQEAHVQYCDICGRTQGDLQEEGEYHFHDDCADDVFTEEPLGGLSTDEHVPQASEAPSLFTRATSRLSGAVDRLRSRDVTWPSMPSLSDKVPSSFVPPVVSEAVSQFQTFIRSHAFRMLFWPIGGLWWAKDTDFFGNSHSWSPTLTYLSGCLFWFSVCVLPLTVVF